MRVRLTPPRTRSDVELSSTRRLRVMTAPQIFPNQLSEPSAFSNAENTNDRNLSRSIHLAPDFAPAFVYHVAGIEISK
jgi:hypothetical protein